MQYWQQLNYTLLYIAVLTVGTTFLLCVWQLLVILLLYHQLDWIMINEEHHVEDKMHLMMSLLSFETSGVKKEESIGGMQYYEETPFFFTTL